MYTGARSDAPTEMILMPGGNLRKRIECLEQNRNIFKMKSTSKIVFQSTLQVLPERFLPASQASPEPCTIRAGLDAITFP
jgi:hypothetical protein